MGLRGCRPGPGHDGLAGRVVVEEGHGAGKYVEFAIGSVPVKLALYKRRGLAKVAGVSADGSGSHRLTIGSNAGPFTGPDGFAWTAATETASL